MPEVLQGSAAIAGVLLAWIGDVVVPESDQWQWPGSEAVLPWHLVCRWWLGLGLFDIGAVFSVRVLWGLALVAVLLGCSLDERQDHSSQIHGQKDEGPWLTPGHRRSYFHLCRDRLNHFVLMAVFLMLPQALVKQGGGWRPWSFLSGGLSAFVRIHCLAAHER